MSISSPGRFICVFSYIKYAISNATQFHQQANLGAKTQYFTKNNL